jgi:hypothetical protein
VKTIKDSVSRAKRLVMSTRTKTVDMIIVEQQAKLTKLEDRLGHLMTQRADLEETIAELMRLRPPMDRAPKSES